MADSETVERLVQDATVKLYLHSKGSYEGLTDFTAILGPILRDLAAEVERETVLGCAKELCPACAGAWYGFLPVVPSDRFVTIKWGHPTTNSEGVGIGACLAHELWSRYPQAREERSE